LSSWFLKFDRIHADVDIYFETGGLILNLAFIMIIRGFSSSNDPKVNNFDLNAVNFTF